MKTVNFFNHTITKNKDSFLRLGWWRDTVIIDCFVIVVTYWALDIVIIDVSHIQNTCRLCINWEMKNQNERLVTCIHTKGTVNTTNKWWMICNLKKKNNCTELKLNYLLIVEFRFWFRSKLWKQNFVSTHILAFDILGQFYNIWGAL